jgi:hypothetical protein
MLLITLMMEAASASDTLFNFYQTTLHYNPEDSHLYTRYHENLKCYMCAFLIFCKLCTFQQKVSASADIDIAEQHKIICTPETRKTKNI